MANIPFLFERSYRVIGQWRKPTSYMQVPLPAIGDRNSWKQVAWEFLRRNMAYQKAYFDITAIPASLWERSPTKNPTGLMDAYWSQPIASPGERCSDYLKRTKENGFSAIRPLRRFKLEWRLKWPKNPREGYSVKGKGKPTFITAFSKSIPEGDHVPLLASSIWVMPFQRLARIDLRLPIDDQLEFIGRRAEAHARRWAKDDPKRRKKGQWVDHSKVEVFPGVKLPWTRAVRKVENYRYYLYLIDLLAAQRKDPSRFGSDARKILRGANMQRISESNGNELIADLLNLAGAPRRKGKQGTYPRTATDVARDSKTALARMAGYLTIALSKKSIRKATKSDGASHPFSGAL